MYYDQHVCGARIQELRKSKGYTQEALAEAIDIDAKRISKIERGVISASYNDMILFFGILWSNAGLSDYWQETGCGCVEKESAGCHYAASGSTDVNSQN